MKSNKDNIKALAEHLIKLEFQVRKNDRDKNPAAKNTAQTENNQNKSESEQKRS
ncbi:MAG: hypothetical protein WCZ89_02160 [Phycisphaerae bacterium]